MASLKLKEQTIIKALLKEVIASCEEREAVAGDNPQIVAMRAKAKAERELSTAVLDALGGNLVELRLYAKGV